MRQHFSSYIKLFGSHEIVKQNNTYFLDGFQIKFFCVLISCVLPSFMQCQVKTKYQPGSYNFPKFLGQLSQQYRQNQQHSQAQQQKSEEGEEDEQIEAYKQEERLVQVCDHNSFDGLLPSRLSGLLPLQSDLSLSKLLSCVNSETFRNFDQLGMDHNNLENTNRQPALEDTDQEDRKRQLGDQDLSARKRPKNGTSKDA
eukprot:TRINITY_DN10083_c0_g1_i11.p3 TRINITY_DN10083_c0_g1~~TRINITY_DN10083_c0_g1_i11.p3  ORF type:complete len:199 (+),score=7.78 TRINITY_DN10083_c0_g1_i11:267-863(+)